MLHWTATGFRGTLRYGAPSVMPIAWTAVAGTAAALCTTLAFLPQFFSLGKRGNKELSPVMLAIYLGGQGLWFAYGLMIASGPIVGEPEPLARSEEHTSELQSHLNLVYRLLLEKKKRQRSNPQHRYQ